MLSKTNYQKQRCQNELLQLFRVSLNIVKHTLSAVFFCFFFLLSYPMYSRFLSFISSLLLSLLLALYPSAALSRCRPSNLCERATSRLRERRRRRKRVGTSERLAKWKRREGEERERAAFSSRQTAPGRCKGEGVRSWKISMYPSWRHDVSLNLALRVWSAAPPPG